MAEKLTLKHRHHLHALVLDGDEIVSLDEHELKEPGYVTRARNGELIACLSRTDCDKD